ncbi:unnamed protein product [Miscanthus lutarioriparius]|uniref:DUF4219 domain-containing protein n=1 Tax=Miscanthus lutarioriparius TaxID=422564 RepID=A0A811N757_9POAL|nr:unnamed protein product [Miscanthus lutarioriparius]
MASQSPSKEKSTDADNEEKKPRPSTSPSRRRRGRSNSRRRSGSRVVERVIERPSANVAWPMLTRTNYPEWALVMEVNFQTLRVWDAVDIGIDEDPDEDEYQQDRQAMAGLLRSVPSEMWGTLGRKRTVKEAWDAVKVLRVGDGRARDASAQQLRREFGALVFKEGESVSEFGIRITSLAVNLRTLGDHISDAEVVKKLLQVVPERLSQAAVSLEMFLDLNTVSIEDVIGRLRVFEERGKPKEITDGMGRLLLCEEDWEARRKTRREQESSGGGSGSNSRGKPRGRGRGRGGSGSGQRDGRDGQGAGTGNAGGGKPPRGGVRAASSGTGTLDTAARHEPDAVCAQCTAAHWEHVTISLENGLTSSRLDVQGGALTNDCRAERHQGDTGGVRNAAERRPEPRRGRRRGPGASVQDTRERPWHEHRARACSPRRRGS